jgi:hypothetical protein
MKIAKKSRVRRERKATPSQHKVAWLAETGLSVLHTSACTWEDAEQAPLDRHWTHPCPVPLTPHSMSLPGGLSEKMPTLNAGVMPKCNHKLATDVEINK